MARLIGSKIGQWEDASHVEDSISWSEALRLRLLIDVNAPLKRALRVRGHCDSSVVVRITYERLPNFCYLCGRLGYLQRLCDLRFVDGFVDPGVHAPYGPWLRENSFGGRSSSHIQSLQPTVVRSFQALSRSTAGDGRPTLRRANMFGGFATCPSSSSVGSATVAAVCEDHQAVNGQAGTVSTSKGCRAHEDESNEPPSIQEAHLSGPSIQRPDLKMSSPCVAIPDPVAFVATKPSSFPSPSPQPNRMLDISSRPNIGEIGPSSPASLGPHVVQSGTAKSSIQANAALSNSSSQTILPAKSTRFAYYSGPGIPFDIPLGEESTEGLNSDLGYNLLPTKGVFQSIPARSRRRSNSIEAKQKLPLSLTVGVTGRQSKKRLVQAVWSVSREHGTETVPLGQLEACRLGLLEWRELSPVDKLKLQAVQTELMTLLQSWIRFLRQNLEAWEYRYALVVAWHLWNSRNSLVMEDARLAPMEVVISNRRYISVFDEASLPRPAERDAISINSLAG
ncbi:hypothetical protein Salat_2538300 [Sesamum alatum]|uniref:Zinc knuckle CX2CX4HX4C domain-containing protein n=1 Tax=Sesamum alatum TaxID=300844 RepID=A0AAE1XS81_9LAMI|nr:hypothetical protein Salat_2538300 [Sesamum alatum]